MVNHTVRTLEASSGYVYSKDIYDNLLRIPGLDEMVKLGIWYCRVTGIIHYTDEKKVQVVVRIESDSKSFDEPTGPLMREKMLANGWQTVPETEGWKFFDD